MNYDIIGDVHGDEDRLTAMLQRLGYRNLSGAWRQADRQAIFVGDLIDRGPKQVATCDIVRRMVDAGSAQMVMGNHEFNAIAWLTPDPENPGEYLRRLKAGNHRQHADFIDEVEGTPQHQELIDWFMTLPLWLDLGVIRVIHAQWHAAYLAELAPRLGPGNRLTPALVIEGSRKGSSSFKTIEGLLKGLEVSMANGGFIDKHGVLRNSERVRWWETPEESTDNHRITTGTKATPLFFGHYSLPGNPAPLSPTVACVDYYRAVDNPLVAYRWDGETTLSKEKFVMV